MDEAYLESLRSSRPAGNLFFFSKSKLKLATSLHAKDTAPGHLPEVLEGDQVDDAKAAGERRHESRKGRKESFSTRLVPGYKGPHGRTRQVADLRKTCEWQGERGLDLHEVSRPWLAALCL